MIKFKNILFALPFVFTLLLLGCTTGGAYASDEISGGDQSQVSAEKVVDTAPSLEASQGANKVSAADPASTVAQSTADDKQTDNVEGADSQKIVNEAAVPSIDAVSQPVAVIDTEQKSETANVEEEKLPTDLAAESQIQPVPPAANDNSQPEKAAVETPVTDQSQPSTVSAVDSVPKGDAAAEVEKTVSEAVVASQPQTSSPTAPVDTPAKMEATQEGSERIIPDAPVADQAVLPSAAAVDATQKADASNPEAVKTVADATADNSQKVESPHGETAKSPTEASAGSQAPASPVAAVDNAQNAAAPNPDAAKLVPVETAAASSPVKTTSDLNVDNGIKGDTIKVGVISWRDLPFQTVKHQAFDYSCGSAALATLMTYTYNMPVSEKGVFEEMFAKGDQNKIRTEGFSLLDMSRYLNDHGLEARGYQITLRVIEKYKLPVIALVNNNGYNHFVVVKTLAGNNVLVGDPNTGNKIYSREDFSKIWNGVALVVTNESDKAREAFDNKNEWRFAHAHVDPRQGNDIGNETAQLTPMQWQIAPTNAGIDQAFTVGIVATSAASTKGP